MLSNFSKGFFGVIGVRAGYDIYEKVKKGEITQQEFSNKVKEGLVFFKNMTGINISTSDHEEKKSPLSKSKK